MGRIVPLPAPLRAVLVSLLGEGVDRVQIVEHSWFARMHVRVTATTRRRRIYLRGSAADFFANPGLMLHEYCHVLKQWEPRLLSTTRYLCESLRRGYWNNRFEIEAREFAASHLHHFYILLAQQEASQSAPNRSLAV